jgi:predicted Zn finger-like uncharacterized protein
VVAQCPSCQSKFRIADEKVTERGVRVRCSSCKTVFQVRKSGSDGSADPDLAGTTLDLQGFETGRIPTGKVKPGAPPRKPTTGPLAGPGASKAAAQSSRRLDADDLFGMDELTGEAAPQAGSPLAAPPRRGSPLSRPAAAKPSAAALSFDDLDPKVEAPEADEPAPEPKPRVRTGRTDPVLLRTEEAPGAGAGGAPGNGPEKDDYGDLDLERPAAEAPLELSTPVPPPSSAGSESEGRRAEPRPEARGEARAEAREVPAPRPRPRAASRAVTTSEILAARSTGGAIAASALTGVVAAAATLAVLLLAGAFTSGSSGLPKAISGGNDVVATHIASGLYDTSSGHPVFFVRGRVENHATDARGPFRVIAELVAEGGASDVRAETLAGRVPSPEEVYALNTAGEIDKFARSLAQGTPKGPIPAGESLPFLALIAEPPQDLKGHTLRVRVEAADPGVRTPRTALKPAR